MRCAIYLELWVWTQPIRYLLSTFFVTKNKIVETDLQLEKAVKLRQKYRAKGDSKQFIQQRYVPVFQGNLVRQQFFVIQIFLFRVYHLS